MNINMEAEFARFSEFMNSGAQPTIDGLSRRQYISRVASDIIQAAYRGKIASARSLDDGKKLIRYVDREGKSCEVEKEFLNKTMPEYLNNVLESTKKDLQSGKTYDVISSWIMALSNAMSREEFNDTAVQKISFDFFKWLKNYMDKNIKNSDGLTFREVLGKDIRIFLVCPDEYIDSLENYYPGIKTMCNFNLLDSKRVIETQFLRIPTMTEEIPNFIKNGFLANDRIIEAIGEECYQRTVLDLCDILEYFKNEKDSGNSRFKDKDIGSTLRKTERDLNAFLSDPNGIPIVVDSYLNGQVNDYAFEKVIKHIKIEELSARQIVGLLTSPYRDRFNIDSRKLLNMYGTKLSGSQCITLAENGRINSMDLIDIAYLESVKHTSPELAVNPKELIDFYSPFHLYTMYQSDMLNPDFCQKYFELVKNNLDELEQEIHFANIVLVTRQLTGVNSQDVLMDYYKSKLIPGSSLEGFVSYEKIDEMYWEEELGVKDILQLAQDGVFPKDKIDEYCSFEEVLEKIISGELDDEFLNSFETKLASSKIKSLYAEDKCPLDLVMKAYLKYDILNIETLNESFELKKPEEDLSQFITEGVSKEKIKELFLNYHISYEDLSTLLHKEIISEEDFNEIKNAIDKVEFYNRLGMLSKISISTSETKEKNGKQNTLPDFIKSKNNARTDFDLEKEAFEELFETPKFEDGKMPVIESYNSVTGRTTTLNNYLVIPIEKYGLVAFEKFEAGNSLFIVPYQQADYFLQGHMELLDPKYSSNDRNKKTLYDMECVRAHQHTKNFWKNVVDSCCELSEEARKALKPNGKYSEIAQKYITSMRDRYVENTQASK